MLEFFNKTIVRAFNVLGINIYGTETTYFSRFRRGFVYGANTFFFITNIWVMLNPDFPFGDRIFCLTFVFGLTGPFIQLFTLEMKRADFQEMLEWVRHMHEDDHVPIVKEYGKHLYEKCSQDSIKMIKVTGIVFGCDIIFTATMPLVLPSISFLFPSRIPFLDETTTYGYIINYLLQIFSLFSFGTSFPAFFLIFIIYILHVICQLKLLEKLCWKIGDYEENIIMNRLNAGQQLKVIAWDDNNEICSVEMDHSMEKSDEFLRLIVALQTDVISLVTQMIQMYSLSIMVCECQMVSSACVFFIMMLVDPTQLLGYGMSSCLVASQYVMVSVLGTLLKTALQNVGTAIYDSKWYCLHPRDRRTVMKILMISQKPMTLKVGPFAEANLERFTGAASLVYSICIVIKFLIQKA